MKLQIISLLTGAVAVLATTSALLADTYTVTNTADTLTAGTLRQAITDANAHANSLNPGSVPDRIEFAIPGSGVHTIAPAAVLPAITDPVVIDGYTQPGAAQNTDAAGFNGTLLIELNGTNAGVGISALTITGGNSTIQGMVINGFGGVGINLNSANNLVEGNFIGTNAAGSAALGNASQGVRVDSAAGNIIGGTAAGARNVISGNGEGMEIRGTGADNTSVQGNFVGTNAGGTAAVGNLSNGIRITNGPTGTIVGGTATGARNVISGNQGAGVDLENSNATGSLVQGNYIGTDVTGALNLGNTLSGVFINGAPSNTIGGSAVGAGNVISGNGTDGVSVTGATAQSNQISGNLIGRNATNDGPVGNTKHGVFLMSSGPNIIGGGFNPNNANTIANNGAAGVAVVFGAGPCIKKGIISNSIFANGGLGIDLEDDGVTPNDVGDADTGANTLQNFPVLTSATTGGGSTTIEGSLNSTADTSFYLEFFASAAADPTEYGEGQTFLGFKSVMTDGSGNVTFSAVLPVVPPAGQTIISSTTSDNAELANTSEFSKVVQIAGTAGELLNISTRGHVLTGDNVLIGGFIITGTDPKKVIIRALGPSLTGSSVPDALANPTLALYDGNGAFIVSNDDWKTNDQTQQSQEAEVNATGLAPTNDFESAIVRTLTPGAYTAIVQGKNGTTGVGLAEIYDLDQAANSILANISTRGFVDTGDNVLIGGVIVGGGGGGSAQVIVRALGPSLSSFGISDPLQDPILELHDSNGAPLISNDDWKTTQQTEIEATGLAPTNDAESAIVFFAPPGKFTAIVSGKSDTTGVGLVEVYKLQ